MVARTDLDYSTFLGGGASDPGSSVALDGSVDGVSQGAQASLAFPPQRAPLRHLLPASRDGYVTKLVPLTEHTYVPLVLKNHP